MDNTAVISLRKVTRFKLEFDRDFPDRVMLFIDAPPVGEASFHNSDAGAMMLVKHYHGNDYPYRHTSSERMIVTKAAREILALQGIVFKDPISQDMEYSSS